MPCSRMTPVCCLAVSGTKYPVTQRHIPEKVVAHSHCCENLKTRMLDNVVTSQKQ